MQRLQRRALWASLAISLLAHGLAIALLSIRDPTAGRSDGERRERRSLQWIEHIAARPERPDDVDDVESVERREAGPLEVTLVPTDLFEVPREQDSRQTPARAGAQPVGRDLPPEIGLQTIDDGRPSRAETANAADSVGDRARSNREQAAPSPAIPSPRQAARAIVEDRGAPPSPPPRSPLAPPSAGLPRGLNKYTPRDSELRPGGGGTYRAETTVFTAKIDRDGKVDIEDKKPNLGVRFDLLGRRELDRATEDWHEVPYDQKRGKDVSPIVTVVVEGFDLTDAIARAAGQDPYYHRKKQFLDRTREERSVLASTERTRSIDRSRDFLSSYLIEIWSHKEWSMATRRRILFELWDECAETGSDQMVAAGQQARKTIVAFIRLKLPSGTAHAYTDKELGEFNRKRQSKRRFDPYR
ncbi:MAG: hypothetical protein MJE77_36665 [Proteobacteria bacterium]|nr:hypothetical protein [Pseudomonadota bacterium]